MQKAVIAASLLLIGCSNQNDAICEMPPPSTALGSSACVHRIAYQYARSTGDITELSNAVIAKCRTWLSKETEYRGHLIPVGAEGALEDLRLKLLKDDALNRIVQAKAGNCDLPS